MKLSQNVYLHEIYVRNESRSHWVKYKVTMSDLRKTMCTLQRAQFKCNLHKTLPECLSKLNLDQDQNWVMSAQILRLKVNS